MKLLHVIASVNPSGGGPIEGIRQLQAPLRARGIEADVCCGDSPDAPYVLGSSLNLIALGPAGGKYGFNLRMLTWLRDHARDYDAVVVEGIWQFHALAVCLALRGTGVPYFVFTHGMLDPWFRRRYPLKHLKKCLYWPLGDYWVLRRARAVLFTCRDEQLLANGAFWPYRCNPVVVGYGTAQPPDDTARLRERFLTEFLAVRDKRIFLFLGRVHEKKGCDLLLEAFGRVAHTDPSLHLVIAGPAEPAMRQHLGEIARRHDVHDRVTWTGMLSGDVKWGAYHAAEAFCLPSHQENFGVAVAEALGCGVPVLISDKVNIWREIVADGAGLAGADTFDGTVATLHAWVATPPSMRQAMRIRATDCFARRFEVNQVAQRLVDVLRAGRPDTGVERDAEVESTLERGFGETR